MFSQFLFALMLTAGGSAPAEDWTPFYAFMGSWTGRRASSAGEVSVTRDYESLGRSPHLLVTDRVAAGRLPWGLVGVDAVRGGFMLQRIASDGSMSELLLTDISSDGARLVFDTAPGDGGASVERITQERHGWNEFVERVEARTSETPFTLVSETQFRRKR